ncbi:hypothetical protein LUZ62_070580 [Rhynchospora pubera]|uniref:ENTH domain-containing protein n=1 Tax=Rhynchospora pubera TaxID=906938 RepID=A0AAV8CVZ2_9POAL|nr:hypothetical protein LUZ62_070580 [Rhynchospora pubera]
MLSVLKRAVNAVKDQTSVSLARVSNYVPGSSCNLDVAILKATSHDEQTAEEKHIIEVILLVAASTISAAACVHALARRIARTHNWIVALKSLHLAHHLLRDGGTYFSHEAASLRPVYSGGRRLLDLSNFSASQSSYSNPWDYTAFVRTYARYLDARLESALFGKLRNLNHRGRTAPNMLSTMKPAVLLDHIEHWRRLLDRAISMRPTGPARNNRLIHITLFMISRESFDFYRDITAGLTLLLDKFFQLDQKYRMKTVEACDLAAKQFEELDSLYDLCIKIGVGRMLEYPHVQKISHDLVTTLKSYLYDSHMSFESSPTSETRSQPRLSLQGLPKLMSEEAVSDSYSVVSEPIISQKKKLYEQINYSSLVPIDTTKEKTKQSDSEGWELLLVETASKLSDTESNNSYGQQLMLETAKKPIPDNYKNPFVQNFYNQGSKIDRSVAVNPNDLLFQDSSDRRKLSTKRRIPEKPKKITFQHYFDEGLSTEISIAEKPTQYSLSKNISSTERSGERTNDFAVTEKISKAPAQTLTTPPSSQQPVFQRHLRWMEEQQKVYRSLGR